MADRDLHAVFAALQGASDPAPSVLCVGGCVRDALMDRPVVDVDLATVHPPDVTLARLKAAGIGVLGIGIEHGTVVARFGHKLFQITTLRVDVETDGRHARVAYTNDWETDASRRDFTMNALYTDLDGNVYDPLGGADDIAARRVRFIGDANKRIEEDALRILRFFRFHAQIEDGEIDPDGLAACADRAGDLANLSGERIREEIFKLLVAADPVVTWQMLLDARILDMALLALTRRDRLAGLVTVEGVVAAADPVRRLAALMDGGANVDDMVARLRLSNRDGERLRDLKTGAIDINPDLPQDAWKARLYKAGGDSWRDTVMMNWAGELADGRTGDRLRVDAWRALEAFPATWPVPVLSVRGADVIALGVPEGPEVSRLLKDIESWWIEGGFVAERGACLAELKRRVSA
ncbi:MAG: CCA tRNA nucleotidyltransferase [Proteobacteria bacterium]|nr:CCA tRNA nucleotidyltransferase [Pseudomonadota bacterium]